jgi:hypothetical protein
MMHGQKTIKFSLSRNEEHKFLLYIQTYLPNYTASLSKRLYTSLRRAAHNPRFKMKQMVHVACKSKVVDGYVFFRNFKERDPLVETSVDGRIILIVLKEVGCACTGNISLLQCNAKWRACMLLTEFEQD